MFTVALRVFASNPVGGEAGLSPVTGHAPCAQSWNDCGDAASQAFGRPELRPAAAKASETASVQLRTRGLRLARQAAAVMLHLRSCYVSKAAIFTVPALPVPVEKSKSRLNSKGLDR
jgi:hypothetical protein